MEHCTRNSPHGDDTFKTFYEHSSAQRVNTTTLIARTLRDHYPQLKLVIVPVFNCDLFGYASQTGKASFHSIKDDENNGKGVTQSLHLTAYSPPVRRTGQGFLVEQLLLDKFSYSWNNHQLVIYLVDGRDGTSSYPQEQMFYILTPKEPIAEALISEAGRWSSELHNEVWVFDSGYWQKSAELFESAMQGSWDNVILDPDMKKALINDHTTFFQSKNKYLSLKVPWKRGVIYYGPPGNGKTISIKAMMHHLYNLEDPIPTLYVRSLTSSGGSEYSIKVIFEKARMMSPCYLVLEDLDSIITDHVRSYFLNEVDGLKSNDGIFMVGSTNHLDRLDEGVSKRPSRFDRKYFFADPNKKERIAYCHFWQTKLKDNRNIAFPDILCDAIADITDKFSFAYMQEAFVAALLSIALDTDNRGGLFEEEEKGRNCNDSKGNADQGWVNIAPLEEADDLEKYPLWIAIKKQVHILREGMKGK